MLLEMALAEFSHERYLNVTSDSSSPDRGECPVDSSPRQLPYQSYERGGGSGTLELRRHSNTGLQQQQYPRRSSSRRSQLSVDVEAEQVKLGSSQSSHIGEVAAARGKEATLDRSASTETFDWEETVASVPFEWEDSPGKSRMVQESRSFGRSNHPEPLPLPPALRPLSVASPRSVRSNVSPNRATSSQIKGGSGHGIGGKVKSILSGRGPTGIVKEASFAALPERTTLPVERGAPQFSGRGPEDVDRILSDSSDDGEGTSPVSTLDLPMSPIAPSYSPQQQGPQLGQESVIRRQQAKLMQARPMPANHWTNALMCEELPAVMEEDEEDLESVYGYHTMEFQTVESSPSTSEDRRDWRISGRDYVSHSKSLSAPNSRQNSSLRPSAAESRNRRRSDFDWPEDFEERPEEVVKEVDESLWAFSPVNSTFVFSGNDHNIADSRHRSPCGPRVHGGITPPTSSPGLGALLDHIALRTSLVRSASSKPGKSSDVEYPGQRSSRLRRYTVNGDDDYASGRGLPMKRSYSCLPFFSLCSTQRPTTISFSQRLGPTISNLSD